MIEKVNKYNQINPRIRNNINGGLETLNDIRDDLPLDSIDRLFRSFGLRLIQEDGTDFEVILTGSDGNAKIPIAEINNDNIINNHLAVTWYRYDTGRFDFNCYLS